MRFNSSPTCAVTRAAARGCIQADSYLIQRRFAAEKWVMRDDDPPVGCVGLSRGFREVGGLVFFDAQKNRPRSCDARAVGFSGNLIWLLRGRPGRLRGVPRGRGTVSSSHS